MRRILLALVACVLTCVGIGSAYADKDTACEAYALSAMRQIQKTKKYPDCLARGLFAGDRWRNDFNDHYNACAQRYDMKTKAHTAFTQAEKKARDGQLSLCVAQTSAQSPAGERIEDHPCFSHCSSSKCGGATKEVRDACILDCLQSTNCTPH